MIKPSELRHLASSMFDSNQRVEIEAYIDERLRQATVFPCALTWPRSGWSNNNILKVLELYREAGWIVADGADSDVIFGLLA